MREVTAIVTDAIVSSTVLTIWTSSRIDPFRQARPSVALCVSFLPHLYGNLRRDLVKGVFTLKDLFFASIHDRQNITERESTGDDRWPCLGSSSDGD